MIDVRFFESRSDGIWGKWNRAHSRRVSREKNSNGQLQLDKIFKINNFAVPIVISVYLIPEIIVKN